MARQIPIEPGIAAQRLDVRLDGRRYVLHLRYMEEPAWWLLDLHDAEDRPLLPGLRLVPSWPLTRRIIDDSLPPGELWVIGPRTMPTLDSLGDEHGLLYVPAPDDEEGST